MKTFEIMSRCKLCKAIGKQIEKVNNFNQVNERSITVVGQDSPHQLACKGCSQLSVHVILRCTLIANKEKNGGKN